MRIVVAFFGITRSLSLTVESIRANVVSPARSVGETVLVGHFFDQNFVENPRTGESSALDPTEYKLLGLDSVQREQPSACLERWDFDRIRSNGDHWKNGFTSTSNLVHQLHSLWSVTKIALEYDPDIVAFVRPDLRYHDSLETAFMLAARARRACMLIPRWQWYGYLNDRFSICRGVRAIQAYGLRVERIPSYFIHLNRPLHSETLMRFAVDCSGLRIVPIEARASRVRAGGEVVAEDFSNEGWERTFVGRVRRQIYYSGSDRLHRVRSRLRSTLLESERSIGGARR